MTVQKSMEKSFKSSLENAKSVVLDILDFLKDNIYELSNSDFFDLKLVLNELILNAVIHGNNEDITKTVNVYVEVQNNNIITAVISDEGDGYNYNEIISNDIKLFKENGRGICLVSALMDTLSFNEKGNIVKFTKKVNV